MNVLLFSIFVTASFIVLSLLLAPKIVRKIKSMKIQILLDGVFAGILIFFSILNPRQEFILVLLGNTFAALLAAYIFLLFKKHKHNPKQNFVITTEQLNSEDNTLSLEYRANNVLQKLRGDARVKLKQYQKWHNAFSFWLTMIMGLVLLSKFLLCSIF